MKQRFTVRDWVTRRVSWVFFLGLTVALFAAESLPEQAMPGPVREVQVGPTLIPEIRVTVYESTIVEMPPGEQALKVFAGGQGDTRIKLWMFEVMPQAPHFLSVKVTADAPAFTVAHIITEHKIERSIKFVRVLGPKANYDPKVFLIATDPVEREKDKQEPTLFTAQDMEKSRAENERWKAEAAGALQRAETEKARGQQEFPKSLRWGYEWDRKRGAELGIEQIVRTTNHETLVYLSDSKSLPTLWQMSDKKPLIVNLEVVDGGLYRIRKEIDHGQFARGKTKVNFDWKEPR